MKERPKFIKDAHLIFLDNLRVSGVTNMYGAVSYILRKFRVTEKEASKILLYWMRTFSERAKQREADKET